MTTWTSGLGDRITHSAIPASASFVWRPRCPFLEWAGERASLCGLQGHSRRTLGGTGFIVCVWRVGVEPEVKAGYPPLSCV